MNQQPAQPAALDNAGEITDVVVITSGRIEEEFGRPLAARFMGVVRCVAGCGKPFALSSADDFNTMLATFEPPCVTVMGATGEDVSELEKGIEMLLSARAGAPR